MEKVHVICIPYPVQSHISALMKLAKILHFRGIHITFVNTEFNHQRLLNSRGPDSLKGLPDFRFETIPDGLPPPTDPNATQDVLALGLSIEENCLEPFRNIIYKLNRAEHSDVPPVSCIVSDSFMCFTLQAAKEFGIPEMLFCPISFCAYACFLHFPQLIQRGLVPLKDESYLTNGYLDKPIDWIPGMKDIRFKDLPSFVRTTDPNDAIFHASMRETGRAYNATALIFNTFDALEMEVLDAFKSQLPLPPIYTVGPLQLHLNQIPQNETRSIGSNLWKEDTQCLNWLDSKEPNSVVYVNFGSITVMTAQQLLEFAWGLANSKHNFLWIIRPDLVVGESVVLAPEFSEEIKGRGLLASWCPQEAVLNHPSIAGFLTHCGWNSTLESLCSGVPVICWPFFGDQQTICRYLCNEWGVGMEIDSNVKRDEVERLVRELMEGEKGKNMRNKAMEWKKKAKEATSAGGSSYANLDKIKVHVVCIPYPLQSHISAMMKLAKILHFQGFHITFVNTEFNHQRILNTRGPDSLTGLPDFSFETISDGLPPTDPNAGQDILALVGATQKNCLEPFRNLINKLKNSNTCSNVPPVSYIISDACMSFTLHAGKELGIPVISYWAISFCFFASFLHYPEFAKRGLVPLREESITDEYLDTAVEWIPGMKDIRIRDLPSSFLITDPNNAMIEFSLQVIGRAYEATAMLFNTFDALEMEVLTAFKSQLSLPPIYTIGPLPLLLNQISKNELQSLGSNMWKEDIKCLKWLDSKEPNSVMYVNFGSTTIITIHQLVEFAWGLANSKHNFLWIVRPDLVAGESAMLPPEFVEETKERGLLTSWCPQEDVLNHPSVAGFLTHSGWNSTLESLSSGVPLICWPFHGDQQTNSRYSCKNWGVGTEIDSAVQRNEVEKLVRQLMESEKGREMKNKALEWKKIAEEATSLGGSSYVNINKIVTDILVSRNKDEQQAS
ncbi:hypothetical protein MKX03_022181 [Papaver bracteatum]|nr:hypothetical protein MKX03_022181 [Papaver bracteatum]